MFPIILLAIVGCQVLDNISHLKVEFDKFIRKYESDSCIMEIFSKFQDNCDNIDDSVNSLISLKMTKCVYKKLGKPIEDCDDRNCISKLSGDSWTTYITFSHHVDNICFYYKSLIWEKSSEFLFSKLLNSSIGILNELNQSANVAEKLLTFQQDFSNQLQNNLADTLQNFKNINQFLENYAKLEEELKKNVFALESKLNSNNERVSSILDYVNDKMEMIQTIGNYVNSDYPVGAGISFFIFLAVFVWCLSFKESIFGIRNSLYFIVISTYLFERFFVCGLVSGYFSGYVGQIYFIVVFYCLRVIYFLFLIIYAYVYAKGPRNNLVIPDIYMTLTPAWMKKYFTKIKIQNDYLIQKFQTLNKLIEEENLISYN